MPIPETEKSWMNGKLIDRKDAQLHVLTHALHYSSGVFEGIRCYKFALYLLLLCCFSLHVFACNYGAVQASCLYCNASGVWTDADWQCDHGKTCENGNCVPIQVNCTPDTVSGCQVCSPDGDEWWQDSTRCPGEQACVEGNCVDEPPVPAWVLGWGDCDVMVNNTGSTAVITTAAKKKNIADPRPQPIASSDFTLVLRDAVELTPEDGTLCIGEGTYDNLVADQLVTSGPGGHPGADYTGGFYAAIPVLNKDIHIYGAGMGKTILKLANNQYNRNHPAVIIRMSGGMNLGYGSFTLARMTLDGNKANQAPSWIDGVALFNTVSLRKNGQFFDLELKNSPDKGVYFQNSGTGHEMYAYINNIYSHDNYAEGIFFDTSRYTKAVNVVSENDGGFDMLAVDGKIGNTGIFIGAYDGAMDLEVLFDNITVRNGSFKVDAYTKGVTLNRLNVSLPKSSPGKNGLVIRRSRDILVNNSIIDASVAVYSSPDIYSNYIYNATGNSVKLINTLLRSNDAGIRVENSSNASIDCIGCRFEPSAGTYYYRISGNNSRISLNGCTANSTGLTKVYNDTGASANGTCAVTNTFCAPNAVSGCMVCKSDGSRWQDIDSKCASGQKCQYGGCVSKIPSCTDKCLSSGSRKKASINSYYVCIDSNNDGCFEWTTTPKNCPDYASMKTTYSKGACISVPPVNCTPGTVSGCQICATDYVYGSNAYLPSSAGKEWWQDSTRCAVGQVCENGQCMNQPSVPSVCPVPNGDCTNNSRGSVFDVAITKNGTTATITDKVGNTLGSGTDYTQIIRNAIAATPENGSLYIGPGTYDNLTADQIEMTAPGGYRFNVAIPIIGRNIHIYGAGMGRTFLKMADNQYYINHPSLMFFITNRMNPGYTSFTLARMTLDGNKDHQIPFWSDGNGLVLTSGLRKNGQFFDLELQNSPNTGIYFANSASGVETYAYIHNIKTHDNSGEGLLFDVVPKAAVSNISSTNDGIKDAFTSNISVDPDHSTRNTGIFLGAYDGAPEWHSVFYNVTIINGSFRIREHAKFVEINNLNVTLPVKVNANGSGIICNDAHSITFNNLSSDAVNAFVAQNTCTANLSGVTLAGQYLYRANGTGTNLTFKTCSAVSAGKTEIINGAKVEGNCSVGSKKKIACFGDSITQGATIVDKNDAFCAKLKTLGGYYTYNHGVGGDTTDRLLERMTNVTGKGYDETLLLIGTNDLANTDAVESEKDYYDNLLSIVQKIKDDRQQVIISTIPPRNLSNDSHAVASGQCKAGNYSCFVERNNIIRKVSFEKGVCYADIFDGVFNGIYNISLFNDWGHPNLAAHAEMAQIYAEAIVNCLPFDCIAHPDQCYFVQTCTPNATSGCSVCKADGSGWTDTDSRCAGGQTCINGNCSASTTTSTITSTIISSSSTLTTSSTTATTLPQCVMPGNSPPCNEVSLLEVVVSINRWVNNEMGLSDVVDLINSWADPTDYLPH